MWFRDGWVREGRRDGGICRQWLRRAGCGAGCGGLLLYCRGGGEQGTRLGDGGDLVLDHCFSVRFWGALELLERSWRAGQLESLMLADAMSSETTC